MPDTATELDLAREALYRFLAAALRDPRSDGAAPVRDPESRRLARAAADRLRGEEPAGGGRRGFGELPPELLTVDPFAAAAGESHAELCAEYDRVFGLLGAGDCPPHETEFQPNQEPFFRSQQMADVAGFYRAFGLGSPERPDSLPLELEFMAFLLTKERLAATAGEAAVCAEAGRDFFRDHLAWWAPSFATGLRRKAGGGPYAALAQALAAFLPAERRRFGIDTPSLPVRPVPAGRAEEGEGCAACPASV